MVLSASFFNHKFSTWQRNRGKITCRFAHCASTAVHRDEQISRNGMKFLYLSRLFTKI